MQRRSWTIDYGTINRYNVKVNDISYLTISSYLSSREESYLLYLFYNPFLSVLFSTLCLQSFSL